MWIAFNETKVFAFLMAHGHVFTVRHYEAGPPPIREIRRFGRPTGSQVKVETVAAVASKDGVLDIEPLKKTVGESGFVAVEEWVEAVRRQHGTHMAEGKPLWLLKATLLEGTAGETG